MTEKEIIALKNLARSESYIDLKVCAEILEGWAGKLLKPFDKMDIVTILRNSLQKHVEREYIKTTLYPFRR